MHICYVRTSSGTSGHLPLTALSLPVASSLDYANVSVACKTFFTHSLISLEAYLLTNFVPFPRTQTRYEIILTGTMGLLWFSAYPPPFRTYILRPLSRTNRYPEFVFLNPQSLPYIYPCHHYRTSIVLTMTTETLRLVRIR